MPSTLTLHLSGAVGFLSDDGFADDLDTLVEWCAGDAVIDCTGVTLIDSIGISVLVDTQRRLNSQGRLLRVVGLSGTPRRVIVSLGLTEFLLVEEEGPRRASGEGHDGPAQDARRPSRGADTHARDRRPARADSSRAGRVRVPEPKRTPPAVPVSAADLASRG
jgi:anti-anti-sigma factor